MQFHRDTTGEINVITGYGAEGVRVGTAIISRSCIVTPDSLIEDWAADDVLTLTMAQLDVAAALEPELILLGSGRRLRFPPSEVTRAVTALGVGLEVMDTAAACRTYNVLAHEGRHVVAALIL